MGQCTKRDTFEKDGLKATMTKIKRLFSCTLLEEIYRGYMIIWKDFTNMPTVFEKLQFIFRNDRYFDFLAYFEILTPINLRSLWTVFRSTIFLTLIKSEGIHIPLRRVENPKNQFLNPLQVNFHVFIYVKQGNVS